MQLMKGIGQELLTFHTTQARYRRLNRLVHEFAQTKYLFAHSQSKVTQEFPYLKFNSLR